jgi:hypothetical protein
MGFSRPKSAKGPLCVRSGHAACGREVWRAMRGDIARKPGHAGLPKIRRGVARAGASAVPRTCAGQRLLPTTPRRPRSEGAVGLMENGVARIEAEDSLSGGRATTLTGRRESNGFGSSDEGLKLDGDAPLGGERIRRPMNIGSVNVTAKDLERMEGATRRSFRS